VVSRRCLDENISVEEALHRLKYQTKPALVMGTQEQGMRAEVYGGEKKEGNPPDCAYYVRLWIGQDVESIYVSTLPGLITLLSRLGTIVGTVQAL
jgi:tRNA G18 (ribose-2'-O)-methylase SpoU